MCIPNIHNHIILIGNNKQRKKFHNTTHKEKINKILDQALLLPGKFAGMIFPYKLSVLLKPFLRRFYTGWIRRNFSRIGHNSLICENVRLVGGQNKHRE